MVVSLSLSRRGRRLYPPPPLASTHAVDDPPRPHAAASLDGPPPPPRPPWEAAGSRLHSGIAARSELPHRNEVVPLESDIEPSFALNLYPDGYSIGELGKGMFLYLIGDDPKKRPYSRASKALFSDIEYGCLPQDILHGIPCKFQNGSTVCEVRDYRSFFSNGGDDSGDDFPKVNRVLLRMGTECVVKDLSSIADASWTYHDQLIAESTILNALQPRLNLDPTPCLEKLCNSSVKKIDLDLYKGRQHTKGAAVCIENAAREGMPSGTLNSSSVNSPSTIHVNNAQSAVESDTENTIRSSSTLMNSSALCDRKQSASNTSPDHLHQSNEQQACAAILQVDREKGQPQRLTVLPQNRKKSSNPLHERHESKKGSPPNKTARSSSRNSKGLQKSTGTSNKEGLQLGSPKELQVLVKVDQTIGNKDIQVQKQISLSVLPTSHPCASLNTSNSCIEKIPEKVNSLHIRLKEHQEAPIVGPKYSGVADLKDSRIPSVTSFNASSRKTVCEHHKDKDATEPQCTASKRRVSGISTISLNQEINLDGNRPQKVDTQIKPPCDNRSSEEPGVSDCVSSQLNIDLGLHKGRQQTKDRALHISSDATENWKPNEFNVCKGAAVCIQNAALVGMPSVMLNSSSVNCPSSIHVNNAKSAIESDPSNTIQSSSTFTHSCALCDRKQSASSTPAPKHLHHNNEQVDRKNGQLRKRKEFPKLVHESHESRNRSPNKTARLSSQNSKDQKLTGTSNKEGRELESPKGLQVEVKVDRTIGNKDMKAQKQFPLSVLPSTHSCTSLNTSNPCIDKIPEKVNSLHIMLKERHEAPIVDPKKSGTADLKDSRTPSVASFNASSRNAACEPCEDNAATEPQCTASKRNVSGISTSINQEIDLKGKGWQKVDTQIKPPCENRSSEEPVVTGGVSSQLGISSYLESCSGHSINTSEPGIEKILSEVILTTQRHGLNEKAAKSYGLETSWLLPPSEFFQSQNAEEIPYMREETMPYYATKGATSTWKIRRLTFHPSKYLFCNGLVDESHYTLCLLESQALDNHQITVGTIYGDEHTHIATLPTSCHAEKFVDQFISLMKRDGYNLCNDKVCNESSELRQQFEEVPNLGYLTGEYAEYLMCSPSVESSLAFNENNDVGCTFQNRLPDYHANLLQSLTQQWVVTEQSPTMESPEAFFLNPSHPDGLQYSSRILHDQGPLFACNSFAMDLHQFPSVQPSQEVSMDQCLQCRHDIPGFSDTCGVGTSATSYGQWRQVYTQMGNVVYQWDLPALGRQIHSSPRLHDGRSIPWSELQQIWRPHTSARSMDSDDVSVTSTPVLVQLPIPLGYQYLWNGSC